MITHRMPVFATGSRRAYGNPLVYLRVLNILTIGHFTGISIDVGERVLKNGFLVGDKLATDSIVLPQYAVLTNRINQLVITAVD